MLCEGSCSERSANFFIFSSICIWHKKCRARSLQNLQGHKHHIPKLDPNRLGTTISGNNHFDSKERKMPGALTSAFTEFQKPSWTTSEQWLGETMDRFTHCKNSIDITATPTSGAWCSSISTRFFRDLWRKFETFIQIVWLAERDNRLTMFLSSNHSVWMNSCG